MSDLESVVPKHFGNLTAAEIKLLRNAGVGELAVCGPNDNLNASINDPTTAQNWGTDRSIRGELIGWLCANRMAKDLVDPGGIQVFGARIIGVVKLLSVTIEFPLAFACCQFCDEINLQSARTRTLSFTQTHMQSILADGAVIGGAVFIRDSYAGLLQFPGVRIEGQFGCTDNTFDTLILDGGVVSVGVLLRGSKGRVKMTRARIGTDLDCQGALFSGVPGSSDPALDAGGISVEGSVFLRAGFRAEGLVLLHGAQIGFNLDCVGGRFDTVQGNRTALNFDSSVVRGTAFLSDGFQAEGEVRLTSSQIEGDLSCAKAKFGSGLIAERSIVKGTLFWREIQNPETVSLNLLNTSVDSLSDDKESWPCNGNLQLHGFVYSVISAFSQRDANSRLVWLSRLKLFTPQPYRQLASVLKDEGDDVGARQVLYKLADIRAQKSTGRGAKLWSLILKSVVGYGYYPGLSLLWLAGLALLGFALFWGGYCAGIMVPTDKDAYVSFRNDHRLPDYYERFHALVYSAENSFPLVKFGQVDRWQPEPSSDGPAHQGVSRLEFFTVWLLRAFRWGQILLGWFFTTMGIAGVTGIVRRD